MKITDCAIVTCEAGHVIRHSGSHKKGGKKLEIPKTCVRCGAKIIKVVQ